MGYGVNRTAKKSTTRRKKRRASAGPARSAGKSKRRAPKRKSAARVRSTAKVRKSKPKSPKRKKKTSAKKPRTVTRYDPEFGTKVKVAADSWEALNWPSRKPSKKKQQRQQLLTAPLATVGTIGVTAGRKAIEKAGETAGRTALRTAKQVGLGALGITTAGLGAAASSAAILAAGYVVMDKVAKERALAFGDRVNAISLRFAETQKQIIKQYGRAWSDVPSDVAKKAWSDYTHAIKVAQSQEGFVGAREVGSYK